MAYIDLYCERLDPGLVAEPLNAATNLAFFAAAWMLWRETRHDGARPPEYPLLIGLIVAIGIGSALFHTFAETWAMVADLVPIMLFQLAFLWTYARRVMKWQNAPSAALIAGFLAVALYGRQFPQVANGSMIYAPAIAVLLALGVYHWLRGGVGRGLLLVATGAFIASLTFRTVDSAVCPNFPLGTHFLWHLINPLVLYLCVRAVNIATAVRERASARLL